jgi:glycerol-3-phosphate dehydrogenase subunit B
MPDLRHHPVAGGSVVSTLVIGAGLAGRMAALQRAAAGDRVLLLAKGHGSGYWAPGTIDLLADAEQPLTAINALIADDPQHPYALAGRAALLAAITELQRICAAADYPLVGSPEHNLLLPTALGALRPTALLPLTMAAGESRQLHDGRAVLIVGIHGLRDFYPQLIAAALREQGIAADALMVELPARQRFTAANTVHLARTFEQPAARADLVRQILPQLRSGRYARVALPAVLGLDHAAAVLRDLQQQLAVPVFEIPTLPTSVPGMRLARILDRELSRCGVRVQLGSLVIGRQAEGNRLLSVSTEAAAREQLHRADRFILASGGIAGGGIRGFADGRLVDTALDLPLQAPVGRGQWFSRRFLDPAGHAVFRSGVRVDAQFRPLDAAGRVVYDNLTVAGGQLAGCDPLREGSLEGTALATGYAAAAALGEMRDYGSD